MSHNQCQFQTGDRVFHPVYGLGVIEGRLTREQAGAQVAYYGVRIADGSMLSVPEERIAQVGLRPITNGLKIIIACLRSPALPLPDDDRQRFGELKSRAQTHDPMALTQAMRDLLHRGQACRLTPADHKWLNNAQERLSAEAAWVDGISQDKARAAIQHEIDLFQLDQAPAPPKRGRTGKTK